MPDETPGKTMKRRGILAAAGAVVAGIVAKQAAERTPVAADGGTWTMPYSSGTQSTSADLVTLINSGSGRGINVSTFGSGDAIFAASNTGIGVSVGAGGPFAIKVQSLGDTYGLYADTIHGGGVGVSGTAQTGVAGQVPNMANTVAVHGSNTSTTGTNNIGVRGDSTTGTGVYGATSTGLYGVYGIAGSHQGAGGVVGVATQAGTIGFAGAAFAPATDAGYFTGNVSVFGNFAVSGSKFAVVKGADGAYRGMYAVESPECWFEDFGEGTLVAGKAEIKLEPLFAQHVRTDSYHVFLTPHDASHLLAATVRAGQGFSVEASASAEAVAKGTKAADLSGTFSWRVVAKRADIAGERLPVWEMPTMVVPKPEPHPAPVPGKKP
jgi:hypothetical protein